ncbi:MAG: hypothetical protein JSS98_00960 [Bacteroidetes bacterium]|nr:hypothetical protein [Bacteroidota bacterium]
MSYQISGCLYNVMPKKFYFLVKSSRDVTIAAPICIRPMVMNKASKKESAL